MSGELVTSVPATVKRAACWLELGSGDRVTADEGAAAVGEATGDGAAVVGETTGDGTTAVGPTTGDGATATGEQAVQHTTTVAAVKINLSLLFTG
jgi:hypothetical protein